MKRHIRMVVEQPWHLLGALLGGFAAWALPLEAQAQYPAKPIRIIVPVATGGIADYYSRVIGA